VLDNNNVVNLISGTRQKVFPGRDDGSGFFTENWVLKLDAERDYYPETKLVYMGYDIPISTVITFISEKDKSVLMFTVKFPLLDNYDRNIEEANVKPVLELRTEKTLIELDLSGCLVIAPIAYPTMGRPKSH